ncbi:hypothetical protein C5167_011275, partial [Papaver somniferum]
CFKLKESIALYADGLQRSVKDKEELDMLDLFSALYGVCILSGFITHTRLVIEFFLHQQKQAKIYEGIPEAVFANGHDCQIYTNMLSHI